MSDWDHFGKLSGVLQAHVDDFLWAGTKTFKNTVVDLLCQKFQVGHSASLKFKYVGVNISQRENGEISVDQFDYIDSINHINLSRERQLEKGVACTKQESSEFCKLVGKLNWVATQSRPDISFDVCQLSSAMKVPKVENILKANKVLQKIKCNPLAICFPCLDSLEECTITCYSDASLGNLQSGQSSGGYVLFLSGENGKTCPLGWRSKTLRRVVRSTIAAETSAMIDALDAAYFLSQVICEMIYPPREPRKNIKIIAFTDNESLYRNAYSTTMAEERRLRVDIAIIKEMILREELSSLKWIPASSQLADSLTKNGADPAKLTAVLETGHLR